LLILVGAWSRDSSFNSETASIHIKVTRMQCRFSSIHTNFFSMVCIGAWPGVEFVGTEIINILNALNSLSWSAEAEGDFLVRVFPVLLLYCVVRIKRSRDRVSVRRNGP
jgi:hypothetical protein